MLESGLQITRIVSQPFAENSFVVNRAGSTACIIVDPGFDPESIIRYIDEKQLVPAAILNTHGHSDHIAGNEAMKQRWPECPLVIGAGDAYKLTDPQGNLSAPFGASLISPPADQTLAEGDRYDAGGIPLTIRETPGHSCGHIVFICETEAPAIVFGGDVLFQGGIGRTDFPDGNHADLIRSIKEKLFVLPDATIVLPGHGDATTIGAEKATNPFVRG